MKSSTILANVAFLGLAAATGRPSDVSICDYYTKALLKENNAANQEKLLTLVVNTAAIGNYTQPNVGVAVTGILNPGEYNGEMVNLLPYFNGFLASTNNGGKCGVSVNFLDSGGAAALKQSLPAFKNGTQQYMLLTHLYEYFAVALGCSEYGTKVNKYAGDPNLYEVHKFMALGPNEVGYFIEQVGLSAASFGVSNSDVMAVGNLLTKAFDYRCSPPMKLTPYTPAYPQAICTTCDCMLDPNPDCSIYGPVMYPAPAKWAKQYCESRCFRSVNQYCPANEGHGQGCPAGGYGGGNHSEEHHGEEWGGSGGY